MSERHPGIRLLAKGATLRSVSGARAARTWTSPGPTHFARRRFGVSCAQSAPAAPRRAARRSAGTQPHRSRGKAGTGGTGGAQGVVGGRTFLFAMFRMMCVCMDAGWFAETSAEPAVAAPGRSSAARARTRYHPRRQRRRARRSVAGRRPPARLCELSRRALCAQGVRPGMP